jgi:outer membrane protein TolC
MKKILLIIIFLSGFVMFAAAQITLEDCRQKARANYPLVKQYELLEKSKQYNLANANKTYFPQLGLTGKTSWQSDVTEFPEQFKDLIDQMGANIAFPAKDQYKIALELSQTIWDGGITGTQKKTIKAQTEVEQQSLEVSMYVLNNQINQLFFGILLLNEQLHQNQLLQNELQRNFELIGAYAENGIAQQSDLDNVKVEILTNQQRYADIKATKKAYIAVLSAFTGENIDAEIVFVKPAAGYRERSEINRPELKLFDSQSYFFELQHNTIATKIMPRVSLFAQGAYGNPGLNMFKSGFTPYFIGGLQFSWNFGGFYTRRDDRRLIETRLQNVEIQRETFLFNTRQTLIKEHAEIEKLRDLLKNDDEIIALRDNIKNVTGAKVENGAKSVSDLMQDIYAANMSRQAKSLHEIQLLLKIWEVKTEMGDEF